MAPGAPTRATYGGDAVLALLAPEPAPGRGERLQGLFLPSFHPETLVTADLVSGSVTLATFERSLWITLNERELRGPPDLRERLALKRGQELGPPLPGVWREEAPLAEGWAATLRGWLERELAAALAPPVERLGLDGISLLGLVQDASGSLHRLEAWSPRPGEPRHGLFAGLHRAARAALPPGRGQGRLDQLHGYLRLGLPVEDLGGAPRRVRIFGSLSSPDEAALRALFSRLPAGAPLVVDLRELEGMGTLLFPVFQALARERPVAWVAPSAAYGRKQLEDMRLAPSSVFDGPDDAVRSLAP